MEQLHWEREAAAKISNNAPGGFLVPLKMLMLDCSNCAQMPCAYKVIQICHTVNSLGGTFNSQSFLVADASPPLIPLLPVLQDMCQDPIIIGPPRRQPSLPSSTSQGAYADYAPFFTNPPQVRSPEAQNYHATTLLLLTPNPKGARPLYLVQNLHLDCCP